ncbi:hypothetical protein [Musicola paradisiaca]|nr:hypothetical protein [Musicola paradisiaca]
MFTSASLAQRRGIRRPDRAKVAASIRRGGLNAQHVVQAPTANRR